MDVCMSHERAKGGHDFDRRRYLLECRGLMYTIMEYDGFEGVKRKTPRSL